VQLSPARATLLCLAPLLGALIASSCTSTSDGFDPSEPASSAERAQARAERSARQKALAEQSARTDAGPPPEPTPPLPPPPEPVVEVPDAGVDVVVVDAAADAAPPVASADAAPPPVPGDLCNRICARVVACAKEIMGSGAPDVGGGVFNEMVQNIGKECASKCAQEVAKGDRQRLQQAEKCLEAKDCDAFSECVRSVVGDDG
jgi:hypothetical protein